MLTYIVRRLMQAVLVMVVMSGLVFVGLYVVGDPVSMMASPEATELDREAIRRNFGLDQPLWQQYAIFMAHAVRLGSEVLRTTLQRWAASHAPDAEVLEKFIAGTDYPLFYAKDAAGLRRFDGTPLYEHQDPRMGEHPDWGTMIFNYGRTGK